MARDKLSIDIDAKAFKLWSADMVRGMSREGAEKALKGIALEFTTRVIQRNPVDTGRSRAAWTPLMDRLGVPSTALVGAGSGVAKGRREGSVAFDFNGPRQSITITNAVPYIVPLEFGSSDQAQAGMVRITMRELRAGSKFTEELRDNVEEQLEKANRRARGI